MTFEIIGNAVLTLEHTQGEKTSKHVTTQYNLDVSPNVDRSCFLDAEELPTKAGVKALTQVFIQALIGNVHYADQKGYWTKEEHEKYILDEIAKGMCREATVDISTFKATNSTGQKIENS